MPPSPTTPNKVVMQSPDSSISKVVAHSVEKVTSTSKVKQASINEPSPASTYGETAISSTPATPQEVGGYGLVRDMNALSLQAAQIDPAIESIYYSPSKAGEKNYSVLAERLTNPATFVGSYPSSLKAINNGRYANGSSSTSPSSDRVKSIRESPNWRDTSIGFVRQSNEQADDPFISGGKAELSSGCNELSFSPREDRIGIPLSNDNAQAVLPPSACVFVANLMQTQTDEQLEHHVKVNFCQYGDCFVKIRRDSRGMPFAFVQYHTEEDARRAITSGRGMPINGRPCRTEVAKVNRSLYLSRVTGDPISEPEAREILSQFGVIQKVWHSSQTDKEMYHLPEGIWVMYAFFDDARDAQAKCRDHPEYRLEQPPMPENLRSRFGGCTSQLISPVQRRSPSRMLPSLMRRAATDFRSIFVGNLPPHTKATRLREMFEIYGRIYHVDIVQKPWVNGTGINVFAFIEFATSEMAIAAVQSSPCMYGNAQLRVERKESIDPFARRDSFGGFGGSPRNRYDADSYDTMAVVYQSGVHAGMTQATQVQVMPSPVYASYPYYQPYEPSQYGHFASAVPLDDNSGRSFQAHANAYVTPAVGHFQYPQVSTQYVQYAQQPVRPTYQWPPTSNENTNEMPAVSSPGIN